MPLTKGRPAARKKSRQKLELSGGEMIRATQRGMIFNYMETILTAEAKELAERAGGIAFDVRPKREKAESAAARPEALRRAPLQSRPR